ncbi:hypothetical protein D210916BOD24_00320 [Alteromonas sp. D210916BOD_24]
MVFKIILLYKPNALEIDEEGVRDNAYINEQVAMPYSTNRKSAGS